MVDRLTAYVRRGNRNVIGWLTAGAVKMICRIGHAQIEAGVQGHIAEIGVHHGRLFILLALLARPQERSIAIDLFGQQHLNPEQSGHGDLPALMKNCSRYADPSAVIVHEGDSTAITSQHVMDMAGGPIRLFSIDGGHKAGVTFHDLETAENSLAEGGVIILDDCFAEEWPDVSTGFHRFFAKPRRVVPFATGGNKTLLTTPNAAENYKRALVDCGTAVAEREFIGRPIYCIRFERRSFDQRIKGLGAWNSIKDKPGIPLLRQAYRRWRFQSGR